MPQEWFGSDLMQWLAAPSGGPCLSATPPVMPPGPPPARGPSRLCTQVQS